MAEAPELVDLADAAGIAGRQALAVELSGVIIAASPEDPMVLTVRRHADAPDGLPSGPLEATHRTLESGLRAWVAEQTRLAIGHVEQLYTFGDRDRVDPTAEAARTLSIGYLALAREARPSVHRQAAWHRWYRYFPWEDLRDGPPAVLARLRHRLLDWAADAATPAEQRRRRERVRATFGQAGDGWHDERVLERYELLYEVGLVPEPHHDGAPVWDQADPETAGAPPMLTDHRRILATAIGRLRGKIRYRPLVFELMPPAFTFLMLQHTVEGLSGVRLHKPNFRRLVAQQGLVEETGEVMPETGGRPARLLRFRPEAVLERAAPGMRLPKPRAAG